MPHAARWCKWFSAFQNQSGGQAWGMRALCYLLLLICVACNKKPQTEFGRLRELADAGDVTAQFKVGNSYYFRNSKREHALGLEYLEMAAGNGHMEAQFLVGFMYDIGEGQVGRDSKKAGKYLLRAAQQGHAEAQQRMILRTQYGDGVPKNPAKAFMWAVVATANGDPKAARQKRGMEAELPSAAVREGHKMAKAFKAKRELIGQQED
jgi:TPR repeat protein